MRDARKLHHLLVTASYESDHRVMGHDLTRVIEKLFSDHDVAPVQVITYTTSLVVRANRFGLTDAWQALTDAEREYVHEHMPRLFTAIFLAIRGTTPKEKECAETSPNGYPCKVRGEHDVHITDPQNDQHEQVFGSEVWRES